MKTQGRAKITEEETNRKKKQNTKTNRNQQRANYKGENKETKGENH